MNKRIEWIDAAKAIGIILVILGHSYDCYARGYLYGFHMPLFFFLSGLTFKLGEDKRRFFGKKAKGILIPYGIYGIIRFVWLLLYNHFKHNTAAPSAASLAVGIFINIRNSDYSIGLWFLPLLFLAESVVYLVHSMKIKTIWKDLIIIAFALAGFAYANNCGIYLPWGLDAVPTAALFIYVGSRLRDVRPELDMFNKWVYFFCAGTLYTVCYFLTTFMFRRSGMANSAYPDMYFDRYGVVPLYIVAAILGIVAVCSFCNICTIFKKSIVWKLIGQNTLHIYCIHQILLSIIFWIMGKIFAGIVISDNHIYSFLMNLVFVFIILMISCVYIKIMELIVPLISKKAMFRKSK